MGVEASNLHSNVFILYKYLCRLYLHSILNARLVSDVLVCEILMLHMPAIPTDLKFSNNFEREGEEKKCLKRLRGRKSDTDYVAIDEKSVCEL